MPTVADVARLAGVSRSTVSYALSGKRTITEQTRTRVLAAIDELGFTANAGARALALQQTMVIGVVFRFNADEFAPATLQYLMSVTETARELGYDALMVTDPDAATAVRRITSSKMVDGVVMLDVVFDDPRVPVLDRSTVPGALVGLPRDPAGLDAFDLDYEAAGRLVIEHLRSRGHRDLLLITPPKHVFERGGVYAERFRGSMRRWAETYGLRLHVHAGESRHPAIQHSMNAVLDAHPDATALVVQNDATIATLPGMLRERGIESPKDMSIVGLFPKDFGRDFHLPYTSVETSPDTLGREAVQHLVRRMDDPAATPVIKLIAPRLIDRGSIG